MGRAKLDHSWVEKRRNKRGPFSPRVLFWFRKGPKPETTFNLTSCRGQNFRLRKTQWPWKRLLVPLSGWPSIGLHSKFQTARPSMENCRNCFPGGPGSCRKSIGNQTEKHYGGELGHDLGQKDGGQIPGGRSTGKTSNCDSADGWLNAGTFVDRMGMKWAQVTSELQRMLVVETRNSPTGKITGAQNWQTAGGSFNFLQNGNQWQNIRAESE